MPPKRRGAQNEARTVTQKAEMLGDWRERVLKDPELILEDRDLMRVLISANDRLMGGNVVDMRGIAMERLESRLERLEDTHRSVIAAAYENLTGTNQIHRAVLRVLEAENFEDFLKITAADLPEILRVDRAKLVLESHEAEERDPDDLSGLDEVLSIVPAGFVDAYLTGGRDVPSRQVTLRGASPHAEQVFGKAAEWIKSEGLVRLDMGPDRLPGMLAFAAEDPHQFRPSQGTDLLAFFAGVYERVMHTYLG
jgi:uncharacterized protein YigA (DUF484 family)